MVLNKLFEWKNKSFSFRRWRREDLEQRHSSWRPQRYSAVGISFFLPTDFLWFDSQVGHEVTNNKVIVEGAEEQESLFKVLQLYDLFSFVSFLFPVKSLHLAVDFFFFFHTRTISISYVWTKLHAMLIKKKRETVIQRHNEKLSF